MHLFRCCGINSHLWSWGLLTSAFFFFPSYVSLLFKHYKSNVVVSALGFLDQNMNFAEAEVYHESIRSELDFLKQLVYSDLVLELKMFVLFLL